MYSQKIYLDVMIREGDVCLGFVGQWKFKYKCGVISKLFQSLFLFCF